MKNSFPSLVQMQRSLFWFSWLKIPMIAYCRPKIMIWDEEQVVLKIRKSRRTKNHLNSMYFGVLMVGADLAAGMHALAFSRVQEKKISLAFKSCNAQFIKRPLTDVFFQANAGNIVREMIAISNTTGNRINREIVVELTESSGEKVAEVIMELSIKVR